MTRMRVDDATNGFLEFCKDNAEELTQGHLPTVSRLFRWWFLVDIGVDEVCGSLETATAVLMKALPTLLESFPLVDAVDGDDPWDALSAVGFAEYVYEHKHRRPVGSM